MGERSLHTRARAVRAPSEVVCHTDRDDVESGGIFAGVDDAVRRTRENARGRLRFRGDRVGLRGIGRARITGYDAPLPNAGVRVGTPNPLIEAAARVILVRLLDGLVGRRRYVHGLRENV